MKIDIKREKNFFEVLPSIAISFFRPTTVYFGWLLWNVIVEFNNSK